MSGSVWLLRRKGSDLYYAVRYGWSSWTNSPLGGVAFARKQDAEDMAAIIAKHIPQPQEAMELEAVEHVWSELEVAATALIERDAEVAP